MKRSLIVGIDGLDYEFAYSHLDSLPTIQSLVGTGVSGRLRSTVPPLTAPAWTTASTGMSPGKTGITNFVNNKAGASETQVVDSSDVSSLRIWDGVEAMGGESVVIGVPITYPVTPIQGAMVAGLRTPTLDESAVHPPELAAEIPSDFESFISYSDHDSQESEELLGRLYASTDAKFDFLERVLSGDVDNVPDEPELIYFVLSESDWIQHYYLKHPDHPRYAEGEQIVLEYFQHVDTRLSELLELTEFWTVGVLSDHGFGKRISKHVYVNELLRRQGFLTLSDDHTSVGSLIGQHIRSVAKLPGFRQIKDSLPESAKKKAVEMTKLSDEEIDWDKTIAVFRMIGNNIGGVDVYPEASEADREEIIDQIVEHLKALTSSADEDSPIEIIYRGNQLYSGPAASETPDIVFLFSESYSGVEQVGTSSLVKRIPEGGRPSVCHRMDGIFVLSGEDVRQDLKVDAEIADFSPTIYHAMDLPIPKTVDGGVLDVFDNDREPTYHNYENVSTDGVDAAGSEEIRYRLEGLGYL